MTEDTGTTRTTLAWGRGHVRHGRVPEWLLDSDASDRAIRLYALLSTYADRDGASFPSRTKLAARLGCGLTACKGALRDLEAAGALTTEPRTRDDGSQASNLYVLHWGADATGGGREGDRGGSRDATALRARDPLPTELREDPELETSAAGAATATPDGPPKLTKVDGRDLAFDALAEVCGVDPGGNRAREVGIALNGSSRHGLALGIRALAWREVGNHLRRDVRTIEEARESWERFLVVKIEDRARDYQRAMPGAALTPLALAKWWTDLDRPARDAATRAAAEAVRLAEEGR